MAEADRRQDRHGERLAVLETEINTVKKGVERFHSALYEHAKGADEKFVRIFEGLEDVRSDIGEAKAGWRVFTRVGVVISAVGMLGAAWWGWLVRAE
tara:strand:+ start:1277 stop:1567 length:291 start_codon:yes stop_codon:yes gene_type:complete